MRERLLLNFLTVDIYKIPKVVLVYGDISSIQFSSFLTLHFLEQRDGYKILLRNVNYSILIVNLKLQLTFKNFRMKLSVPRSAKFAEIDTLPRAKDESSIGDY